MSVDGARKSENTHTHTHKTATGGRKEEVICPEHCVFIFFKKLILCLEFGEKDVSQCGSAIVKYRISTGSDLQH